MPKILNIKIAEDAQNAVKSLFGGLIQQMLEAEMEEYLGYPKYDYTNKNTINSRNGKSKKTVKSYLWLFDLDVPRYRECSFESQTVKKHQTDISRLGSSIIGMYAKGMSTRDITNQVNEMYDMDVSSTLISNITDKIYLL